MKQIRLILVFVSALMFSAGPGMAFGDKGATNQCDGIAGFQCAKGEYCQHEDGTCDIADRMGSCTLQPQMCTRDYRPVCGCDGNTYGNRCDAESKGVSVDYVGECTPSEN